jgi:hypothetical protein
MVYTITKGYGIFKKVPKNNAKITRLFIEAVEKQFFKKSKCDGCGDGGDGICHHTPNGDCFIFNEMEYKKDNENDEDYDKNDSALNQYIYAMYNEGCPCPMINTNLFRKHAYDVHENLKIDSKYDYYLIAGYAKSIDSSKTFRSCEHFYFKVPFLEKYPTYRCDISCNDPADFAETRYYRYYYPKPTMDGCPVS